MRSERRERRQRATLPKWVLVQSTRQSCLFEGLHRAGRLGRQAQAAAIGRGCKVGSAARDFHQGAQGNQEKQGIYGLVTYLTYISMYLSSICFFVFVASRQNGAQRAVLFVCVRPPASRLHNMHCTVDAMGCVYVAQDHQSVPCVHR